MTDGKEQGANGDPEKSLRDLGAGWRMTDNG